MSEHADTIRRALRRNTAALAALDALEAELAEARRERDVQKAISAALCAAIASGSEGDTA